MARKEKPPRPPILSSATESPAVDSSGADKTGSPQNLTPSSPADDHADPSRAAITQTGGQPATRRTSGDGWDPLKRYWSERNCFPDYGNARGSTMVNLVKTVGDYVFGNFLNGQPARTNPSPTTTAKRLSDATLSQPPKRPRAEEDGTQEVVSLDGSSEVHERSWSASSPAQRRVNPQDSHSIRSSGDRHSRGVEVDEYRTTSNYTGLGVSNKRSRHRKGYPHVRNGHTIWEQESASGSHVFKQRRLVSKREISGDDIVDDEDVQSIATEPRGPNGRTTSKPLGNGGFTSSRFAVPDSSDNGDNNEVDDEDEDDPIARLPKAKHREPAAQKPNAGRVDRATNGMKRPPAHPDDLQELHTAKRRPKPSGRADISRTSFASAATALANPGGDALRVERAICYQTFVYPADDGMYEHAPGATNKPCVIVPTGKEPRFFKVSDDRGQDLNELEWITPNLSNVSRIGGNLKSPVVRLVKALDSTSTFKTGAALIIRFGSPDEANKYSDICQRANPRARFESLYDHRLLELVDQMAKKVKESNMKKSLPLSAESQLVERHQAREDHTRRANDKSEPLQAQQPGHFAHTKALRTQMRADGGLEIGPAASKGLTPRTPAEERQIRDLMAFDDDNGSEREQRRPERSRESPSRPNGREANSRPSRTLRSSKPKARSPSPELARWTDQNPNWIDDRSYKIPLIYERTTINVADIERLDEGQFLNDEVISFYARYLHKQLEAENEQMAKKVYVFSSFFWEKLRAKGYDGVKSWTAKIDLFSFDYVVVPINQTAHWYLAIICNPGGLLPQDDTKLEEEGSAVTEHEGHAGVSEKTEADTKSTTVASDINPIPPEYQLDGSGTVDLEEIKHAPSAKKSRVKRGPGPRKYDPRDPRVITLDSLDGNHSNVVTTLRTYLKLEIKQRKGVDVEMPSPFGMTAKDVPFQTNFTDCGVYLLGYLEEFMKDPYTFTRKILQQEGRDWDVNAPVLRNKIRDLIFGLQKKYQVEEMSRRREKRLTASEKMVKSQTPAAESHSSPRVDSEQTAQQTPVAASPATNSRQQTPARAQKSPVRRVDGDQKPVYPKVHSSISPPPLQRQQTSSSLQVLKSSQSQDSEPEASNVNASMIVHPDDSVEINEEQTASELGATPRVMQSVEELDPQQESQHSSNSPPIRNSPEISETPQPLTTGDVDEKKLMKPLPPSSMSSAASKGSSDRSTTTRQNRTPAKSFNPKYSETESHYFPSSSFRPSSAKIPARTNGTSQYSIIPSSDEELASGKVKTKKKGRPSEGRTKPLIDLTDD